MHKGLPAESDGSAFLISSMYQPRTYRHWVKARDLTPFNVVVKETDLYIRASANLRRKAYRIVSKYRHVLEEYIEKNPAFVTSFVPIPVIDDAPHIVRAMSEAAIEAGVGPMAAVAGAMAEFVGNELLAFSPQIIVENGGDIYLKSLEKRIIAIYAGDSPLTGKIGLDIEPEDTPLGICTSSGTVGHSLSYGTADAVIAVSKSATLADAAATAIGNQIKQPGDIPVGIDFAQSINGLEGVIIILGEDIGLWGKMKVCQITV